jgi:hypothetical protein
MTTRLTPWIVWFVAASLRTGKITKGFGKGLKRIL